MKEKTDGERKEKGQKEEKKVREVKMGKEEEKKSKSEDQGKASGVCMKIFQISQPPIYYSSTVELPFSWLQCSHCARRCR